MDRRSQHSSQRQRRRLILHPTVDSYSYDHGPLWALLSSTAVSISGSSVSDLRLSLPSLNTSILGISVNSQNTYTGTAPYIQDTIKLDMTTTDNSLTDASAQFQAGDFGFSYAGTSYDSAFFGSSRRSPVPCFT